MKKNFPFFPNMKMADVIHADYHLIPVFDRLGIQFGFGNKTIEEVCESHDINIWFFLEIINSYHEPTYLSRSDLERYSVCLITSYLNRNHNFYREDKVPQIQNYIDQLERESSVENQVNIKLLNNFFKEYVTELNLHLAYEDKNIFPYVSELEDAFNSGSYSDELLLKIKEESIVEYERCHDNMELKLSDLKNLIIKFLPPIASESLCQQLLTELFRLENDLRIHTILEDKILIPKVKQLELIIVEQSEDAK